MVLQVKDWGRLYENNRTRDLKRMDWVPIPNRMDGDGYTELVEHENGAAHLGIWLATVQIASRCQPRGILLRDDGRPHTPQSLARMSRLPAALFSEALPRLIEIGWLESYQADNGPVCIDTHEAAAETQCDAAIPQCDAAIPQCDAAIPQCDAAIPHEAASRSQGTDYGREWKERNEGTERVLTSPPPESGIHEFLAAYPKKTSRDLAARAYLSIIETADEHNRLMAGIRRWLASDQWSRSLKNDGGRYIKNPDRFIIDRTYLDEPTPFSGDAKDEDVDYICGQVAREVLGYDKEAA